MRIFTVLCVSILAVISISAQSDRMPIPMPTPVPAASDGAATYSESTPQKKRPAQVSPTLHVEPTTKQTTTSKPAIVKPASPKSAANADVEEVQKVETNLVTIPVSVFDRHGLYVPNLKQENFKIFEDGREQTIEYFGTSEKPFTVILLIDTSPSTEYEMEEIQKAARAFIDKLKPQDKVMVIEFDGRIRVLAEATGDRSKIYKAINRADFGDGTAVYDAVSFSLSNLRSITGRKAIVLFSDGVDTQSAKANYDSTLAMAEEADTLVFPIYYNTYDESREVSIDDEGPPPPGTTPREYELGKKYIEELAANTGGRVFSAEATPGGLTAAFEGIAEELRRQYNIGYIPSEDAKPGQRKHIKVRVNRPHLVLRARDSYIVGAK